MKINIPITIIGVFVILFFMIQLVIRNGQISELENEVDKYKIKMSMLRSDNDSSYDRLYREVQPDYAVGVATVGGDVLYETMEVEATAYANVEECCYPYFDGKTSIGGDANLWGVAVDPKVIPYGSIIEIDGIGKLKADDCGGAIKGNKIDIRFPNGDVQSARRWGRKKITIKIYKE